LSPGSTQNGPAGLSQLPARSAERLSEVPPLTFPRRHSTAFQAFTRSADRGEFAGSLSSETDAGCQCYPPQSGRSGCSQFRPSAQRPSWKVGVFAHLPQSGHCLFQLNRPTASAGTRRARCQELLKSAEKLGSRGRLLHSGSPRPRRQRLLHASSSKPSRLPARSSAQFGLLSTEGSHRNEYQGSDFDQKMRSAVSFHGSNLSSRGRLLVRSCACDQVLEKSC
jgi:hypothetical protein